MGMHGGHDESKNFRFYLLWRRAVIAFLLVFGYFLLRHLDYRAALRAKYQPTELPDSFDIAEAQAQGHSWNNPDREVFHLWQERAKWKKLGAGYEGETFVHENSVIKIFEPGGSLRNCIPSVPNMRWPTEIPASLLLSGMEKERSDTSLDDADFVPVRGYFLGPGTSSSSPRWHLLTPFMKSGNVDKLGKKLRSLNLSCRELDAQFRPSLNRMLRALDTMHTKYDLCHDDVKLDNIFVASFSNSTYENTHWLLADLGNARHPAHPYHFSTLWGPDNGQDTDCRKNDVKRLMRSYIRFLRNASGGEADPRHVAFDDVFFAGQEPWSQLYWSVMTDALRLSAAASVFEISLAFPPNSPSEDRDDYGHRRTSPGFSIGRSSLLQAMAVDQELSKGMSGSEKWARVFGVVGVPTNPC